MNMIFKTRLLILFAAILITACSESYPGLSYDDPNVPENKEALDSTLLDPLYVYINRQSFFYVTAFPNNPNQSTRGLGHFNPIVINPGDAKYTLEDSLKYYNLRFSLLAFRDGKYATTGSLYPAELQNEPNMTWTAMAENGNGHNDPDRLNCLVDGHNYYEGLPTTLDDKTGLTPMPNQQIYYGSYQDIGYNFFVYTVDDFESSAATVHRERDSIYYDLAVDGTQDVMCGYAPKLTEKLLDSLYNHINLSDAERNRILNIGNYSTYAGHRSIDPYINIYHQMTRLQFRAYAGGPSATNTTIDSIYVTAPNSGKLIVAHKDPSRVGFYLNKDVVNNIYLHEKPRIVDTLYSDGTKSKNLQPCELIDSGYYNIPWKDEYWIYDADGNRTNQKNAIFERDHIDIGESIILPEAPEFVITICSTFTGAMGDVHHMVAKYRVTAESLGQIPDNWDEATQQYIFKRARYYTINLAVYGLEEIKVIANIEGWKDGGEIEIDPDSADYINVTSQ